MATEKQIRALEKWLGVELENDIDFDIASEYLTQLSEASAEYKRTGKLGTVKNVKDEIKEELRLMGKIRQPISQTKLVEKEPAKTGVIDGDCDKEEDLTVGDEYEDLEGLEPEDEEQEVEGGEKDLVKQYVQLYADIWEEVLRNKTFAGIESREQGIAVAGVFREIIKTKRTERIAELRREENEEEGE
jgi:hypothetical protein